MCLFSLLCSFATLGQVLKRLSNVSHLSLTSFLSFLSRQKAFSWVPNPKLSSLPSLPSLVLSLFIWLQILPPETKSGSACLASASFLSVRWVCHPVLDLIFCWHLKTTVSQTKLPTISSLSMALLIQMSYPLESPKAGFKSQILLKPFLSSSKSFQVLEIWTQWCFSAMLLNPILS